MTKLHFDTLRFELIERALQITLLKIFRTEIPLQELEKIDRFKLVDEHTLEFPNQDSEKAERKFSFLLSKYLENLTDIVSKNKALYIHRYSGIPLIGNVAFGIVYRNTSLIEIKPVTSCNLSCVYCSVREGRNSGKNDIVVEKEYLLEELQKLLEFVEVPVEIHIGVQGEPFLYADLVPLIEELQKNAQVSVISADTNFTLVTKPIIDRLCLLDKVRLNVSLDAIDPTIAQEMVDAPYDVKRLMEHIRYGAEKGLGLLLAPVFVPGYNEAELEKVVEFAKELNKISPRFIRVGIQNFLAYKAGRHPTKPMSWDTFYRMIAELEKKTGFPLKLSEADFNIVKTKELPKPFVEGEVVTAVVKGRDRFPNTVLAVAGDRTISVPDCEFKKDKKIKIMIMRDKHNIFVGKIC
ncbi:radical SAM protein [Candidatus Woesearchaeota archaeon]|nr:radical SAM protein [Candidatus Woesearchaeota archaeon]